MKRSKIFSLDRLPLGARGRVTRVDWQAMDPNEARRLRELGLVEGAEVEALHRGSLLFRNPLAVKVGRTRFALRSAQATAFELEPAE